MSYNENPSFLDPMSDPMLANINNSSIEKNAINEFDGIGVTGQPATPIQQPQPEYQPQQNIQVSPNNNISSFNLVVDKTKTELSVINFDPRYISRDKYREAIFIILGGGIKKSQKGPLSDSILFDCMGVSTRFNLRWFPNGVAVDINKYFGRVVTCDILKTEYGFQATNEPVVLDIETVSSNELSKSCDYIRNYCTQYKDLYDFLTKISYFDLFLNDKYKAFIPEFALQLKYIDIISQHFVNVNKHHITCGLYLKTMLHLVQNPDIEPDFYLYEKIYAPNWVGESVAPYFVKSYLKSDINTYIIQVIEETVKRIMVGGTIC